MWKTKIKTGRKVISLALLFFVLSFSVPISPSVALAAPGINQQLSYQGFLKNASNAAVSDGTYDIVFRIYDAATGGTTLWTGTHTAANGNAVTVTNGSFSVLLGSGTGNALNLDFNDDSYYLGITIAADAEMTPRQRMGTAGYAFNADRLDGLDSSSFSTSTLNAGNIFVGNASNTAAGVALSGDATISNTGALTIAPDAVTSGKISDGTIVDADVNASAAIALSKLASGSSIVTSLAAPAGSNANGGSIASNALTLSLADGTNPGLVSTGTQTFAGDKTFAGTIIGALTGNIVPFYYADQASFPSAATYHGAVAHSHADGALYYAHDGSWVKLLDTTSGAFTNNGNSLSALATLGTNDNFGLAFETNNIERLRVGTDGSLLLGEGTDGVLGFNYPDTTYDRRARLTAGASDSADNSQGASIDLHGNNHANTGRLDLVAGGATGEITAWTNNTQRLIIDETGKVGIGTATPNNTLQVAELINFNDTDFNTLLGKSAGSFVPSGGQRNSYVGYEAGFAVNIGGSNTIDDNTAVGYQALRNNNTGAKNTAVGSEALRNNAGSSDGVAVGYQALQNNSGIGNTAVGSEALKANGGGIFNVGVGISALTSNTTATGNTGIGANALASNTTGATNTGLGGFALGGNTTAADNVAVGYQALLSSNSANNVAVGKAALQSITSGGSNTALGRQAGRFIANGSTANQTSSNSLYLGTDTKAGADGNTNEIVIGYNAIGNGSNSVTLGNTSIAKTILQGNVGIGTTTPGSKLVVSGAIPSTINPGLNSGTGIVDTTTVPGQTIITYNSSSTFTPPTGVTSVRALVVGGGAGGGARFGGGGGGGNVIEDTNFTVSGATTVTVGAGGAGAPANAASGGDGNGNTNSASNGSNSVFGSITANGGGAGADGDTGNGVVGGNGGGAAGRFAGTAGTSNQAGGFAGGASDGASPFYGGGGGGSGGAGSAGGSNATNPGRGGLGQSNDITNVSIAYGGGAGGGGSSAGTTVAIGQGGGGDGGGPSNIPVPTAGATNRGGGGGGSSFNGTANNPAGAAGGSGVVIVRFTTSVQASGTNASQALLRVTDTGSSTNGTLAFFDNQTGGQGCVIMGSTGLSCSSDARLKKNYLELTPDTVDNLLKLQTVTYDWNNEEDGTGNHHGFVAQNVEALFPQLVTVDPNGNKAVNYAGFAPLFTAGLQELNTKVEAQGLQIGKVAGLVGVSQEDLDAITTEYITGIKAENEAKFAQLAAEWNALREEYQRQLDEEKAKAAVADETVAEEQPGTVAGDVTTNEEKQTDVAAITEPAVAPSPDPTPTAQPATTLTLAEGSLEKLEEEGTISTLNGITVTGESIFEKLATFLGDIILSGRLTFEDNDVAGEAEIVAGDTEVIISFTRAYSVKPIVNATMASANGYETGFSLADITTKGFTIKLTQAHSQDVLLNWSAVAVKDAKRHRSEGNNSPPSATPTAEPSSTPTPATEPPVSPSISPAPSPQPEVSPGPAPSVEPEASPSASATPSPTAEPVP